MWTIDHNKCGQQVGSNGQLLKTGTIKMSMQPPNAAAGKGQSSTSVPARVGARLVCVLAAVCVSVCV
jgi:hypothetical protein